MQDKYAESLRRVLVHEGGKVDDPDDPGGRTNKGVTQKTYNAWRRTKGLAPKDVWLMDDAECSVIYKERYWDVIKADDLPPGVDYVVFDGAVNSGPAQSVKWLQRALKMPADGQLGVLTLDKVRGVNDHDALVASICDQRMAFLQQLKGWKKYKGGWSKRVANVLKTGQAWAMGSVGPEVEYIPNAQKKAKVEDAKPIPTRAPADVTTGVGGAIAVGTEAVRQAKDAIAPATELGYATHILTAITLVGVALAVAGIFYRYYLTIQKRKAAHALGNEVA